MAELIARACGLIPRATAGRVIDVVATYGADWVGRALDRVEERNRKPGNRPVESWGFVLRTLANWRKEGGPPPEPEPAPAPPAAPRPAPAAPGPLERLAAEEIAELVARATSADRNLARIGRLQIRKAVAQGQIAPELVATIPAGILEDPRAP